MGPSSASSLGVAVLFGSSVLVPSCDVILAIFFLASTYINRAIQKFENCNMSAKPLLKLKNTSEICLCYVIFMLCFCSVVKNKPQLD